MSNRADPNSGRKTPGNATKRVRQMTVYDRLEDARKRRQALLAERAKTAPQTPPRATNEANPPKPVAPPPPIPKIADPGLKASRPTAPKPARAQTEPEPHQKSARKGGGYWKGLLQVMAGIALFAVLYAVISSVRDTPENPANAATAVVQPDVSIPPIAAPQSTPEPTPAPTPAPTSEPAIAAASAPTDTAPALPDVIAQITGPTTPVSPQTNSLNVVFAPLISPEFASPTTLQAPQPLDAPPSEFDDFLPFERLVPPQVLTRFPPARPTVDTGETVETVEEIAAIAPNSAFADATNVVLMVPAFAPQSQAEDMIAAAAGIGIPVDQTRRASVSISSTNIRYYHAQDAEAAILLADSLGGQARDFTTFRPPPNPGVIEVWMEGRGGASTPSQSSATSRGIQADLAALRNSIQRALNIATGN